MTATNKAAQTWAVNTQLIPEAQAVRLLRVLLLGGAALTASVVALTLVFFQLTR